MIKPRISMIVLILCMIAASIKFAVAEIPMQHSDAEILGVLAAIDHNEIQMSELAQQKNIDPQVLDYAKMLNREHSAHLTRTENLSQVLGIKVADDTSSINRIRNNGEQDMAALSHVDGDAFAQLYITDMIKGHSEAMNWIDGQSIQNAQIKDFLKDTRTHMAMHFKAAQQIQGHQGIGQT